MRVIRAASSDSTVIRSAATAALGFGIALLGIGSCTGGAGAGGGTGGAAGTGGAIGTGGRTGGGGVVGTGGSAGSAGSGGTVGSGGAPGSGGGSGTGGTAGNGGAIGSGGRLGSGAATGGGGTGGSARTGGAGGAAGQGGISMTGGRGTGGTAGAGMAGAGGRAGAGGAATGGGAGSAGSYDQAILADRPVAYWAMNTPPTSEPDLTGNGNTGSYRGGAPVLATLPNGDQAVTFNGSTQYLTVASNPSFSIPTTGNLTWEAWIRPDVLQFPNDSNGYVDWMGKCANYSPTCEWEARMYSTTNSESRCNRLSAYVFNPTAGLGSAADWQPTCGLIMAGRWIHVVGAYTTRSQPAGCANAASYPGSINIWVNGVLWSQANHSPTGCMSQYNVVPKTNNSPLNIGTMAGDAWFPGAIAKVAIYDALLTQAQVTNHYRLMTGQMPTGTCGNTCTF